MRDAPFAGGRGGSPAAAGQGRCRTRGRRTRGGSSPSCESPPFCFGRRTLCCRKAPLTGTAAKIREPCGRPVRVVVRERRPSLVGADLFPLGVRKGRLCPVRQTGGSCLALPAITPPVGGQGRCRTRGRRTRGGSSPSCGSPPFCFGRRTLCCRKAPLTGTAAKIREPCGRPVRVVVRERRPSLVGADLFPLGVRKGRLCPVRQTGGSCLALPAITRAARPEGRGGD